MAEHLLEQCYTNIVLENNLCHRLHHVLRLRAQHMGSIYALVTLTHEAPSHGCAALLSGRV